LSYSQDHKSRIVKATNQRALVITHLWLQMAITSSSAVRLARQSIPWKFLSTDQLSCHICQCYIRQYNRPFRGKADIISRGPYPPLVQTDAMGPKNVSQDYHAKFGCSKLKCECTKAT